MDLTLLVLAAGLSTRYGGLKQLDPVGPSGEALMDYGIYDAIRAGFGRVVIVTRCELRDALYEHVNRLFAGSAIVDFAYQDLDALPEDFRAPPGRRKPWGTGHAVLSAGSKVREPFVAINADDFYGADAYSLLAAHLRSSDDDLRFAAAGYLLRDTLSPHGGVSRAVCQVGDDGTLRRVTEVKRIEERGGKLSGVTVTGQPYPLTGDETISMNIWAATPAAFPLLRERFVQFLKTNGSDVDAEFLLSTCVNELIASGRARVRVVATSGPWLGVTHREDRPYVATRLKRLIDAGMYPEDLAEAMSGSNGVA